MRLILDPAEDVAHGAWLRETPGAYEWWYFDALSDSGEWALVNIWFLGNPFSPYYSLAARGRFTDPYAHNALFLGLYRNGALYSYHFTRFARERISADEKAPAMLQFGDSTLSLKDNRYELLLKDENANRRSLAAALTYTAEPPAATVAAKTERDALGDGADHFWLPAAPVCRVTADIRLSHPMNASPEEVLFSGDGYHDHNWGRLPFDRALRDWYWARASFAGGRTLIVYVTRTRQNSAACRLLLFERGQIVSDENAAVVFQERQINSFGVVYNRRIIVRSAEISAEFHLGRRLDSAPFYIRALCRATLEGRGAREFGQGIGEYFRPGIMALPPAASAMRSRISEA